MVNFLAPSLIGTRLGYTHVKLCPLILTMFGDGTSAGNRFAHKKLFSIINNSNGDLIMLHGLELLISSSGSETGNRDTLRKLTA